MSINSVISLGISSYTTFFFAVVIAINLLNIHVFKNTIFVKGFVTFSFDTYCMYFIKNFISAFFLRYS